MRAAVLPVQTLSPAAFAPYGWMLGKPLPAAGERPVFSNPATDFWQEHVFDVGAGGEVEILWVNYREADPRVERLEVHRLTEQALVPLTGTLIHVVAASDARGAPDLGSLAAFRVVPGQGLCMRPGCWHATRVPAGPVSCLMLTRASTTRELIAHLEAAAPAHESALITVPSVRISNGDTHHR